mmetsp:Transcript_10394/g.12172  ORF Transcript_10394/g.12172 Transcript_10394/m.12172 type:complete len:583 (-) Transcript_10394:534-2282(-)|eukprot:CAMPEP_0197851180 /NCGR_PEP_ID=MMETSP1438-20131217/17473_1 /TAXON_ID=1461541 /ORGANISM="Pterosperma sp., Strain CCMP1384" /LENGTH=582 /DNA_ID=CAMNT_0043464697 /DNA_START=404 /DNA_END=2152 /DNA_ORIENTATION=+
MPRTRRTRSSDKVAAAGASASTAPTRTSSKGKAPLAAIPEATTAVATSTRGKRKEQEESFSIANTATRSSKRRCEALPEEAGPSTAADDLPQNSVSDEEDNSEDQYYRDPGSDSGLGYSMDYSDGNESDDACKASEATCMNEESRRKTQEADVIEISELLGVDKSSALLLLRSIAWNKEDLLSRYMDNAEKVCEEAGILGPDAICNSQASISEKVDDFECSICRSDGPQTVSCLGCGHKYCDGCWNRYLGLKVDEAETRIVCPEPSCRLQVPPDMITKLCDAAQLEKYHSFMANSFVDDSKTAVWCPQAGCCLSVDIGNTSSKFVTCQQGHSFCIECRQEMHAPADCETVKAWLQKCADDSETFNWLSVNTQDCPKCHATIEKNGGCNHMTCRKCKHDFCWVCLGSWQAHSDYYSCNRYDPAKASEVEDGKAASRAALDRYLFYYHRYMNHENSRKFEMQIKDRAAKKMEELQSQEPHRLWGEVQFVGEATEGLCKCRVLLKWTYVLAHVLKDDSREKNLFCFLQEDLEKKTERLSELLESDVEELLKPEIKGEVLNLANAVDKSRKKLLHGVQNGLSGPAV